MAGKRAGIASLRKSLVDAGPAGQARLRPRRLYRRSKIVRRPDVARNCLLSHLRFLEAAKAFAQVDTIEGKFALANAQAQNHAFEKAINAYDAVLKAQPQNVAARTNRAIVAAALKAQEEKRRKQEQDVQAPPDEKADEMRVDPDQKGGKRIQVTPQDVTTAGAAEAWMREVQTTPFLKLKFAIQAASHQAKGKPQ
jgi:Ca-activated chloride channel homolog